MRPQQSAALTPLRPCQGRGSASIVRSVMLSLAVCLTACTAPRGPLVVTDPDPSIKIPAIQKAVRDKDMKAVPQLIKDLESDDPAVRLYANHALEQLTGQR